jgi:hypothetical protein
LKGKVMEVENPIQAQIEIGREIQETGAAIYYGRLAVAALNTQEPVNVAAVSWHYAQARTAHHRMHELERSRLAIKAAVELAAGPILGPAPWV